jgi:amino acid transporter
MRLRFVLPELYRPYRMPLNIPFGRASIPVLSLLGALAIGSVFTQLLFQNIEQSTWIYMGWLVFGVLAFAGYRRLRREPLWEPLEAPPPPDREVAHQRVPLPRAARIRLGRRERVRAAAAVAVPEAAPHHRTRFLAVRLLISRHGRMRISLVSAVIVAFSALAIVVDVSVHDPFGTQLGWSVGIVLMAIFSILLMNRSAQESLQ